MRSDEVRDLLRRHGLSPRKGLGQHFLLDERVARRAVAYADPQAGGSALEIGPGLGVLTVPLAEAFERVVCVERDPRLADVLEDRLADVGVRGVEVVRGDALEVDLPDADVCVSNLPYRISSPVTFRLVEHGFDRAVLMYQREFAERLCAEPGTGAYGRLTANAALRTDREVLETVPSSVFWPRPDVESALVGLTWRDPPFEVTDTDVYRDVTRSLFSHRRKTSRNGVRLHWDRFAGDEDEVLDAVEAWGEGDRRPATLSPEEIAELANLLARTGRG